MRPTRSSRRRSRACARGRCGRATSCRASRSSSPRTTRRTSSNGASRICSRSTTRVTGSTIVVTSDASTDTTETRAERSGARVVRNPRGGKVAAQDHAVRESTSDVVAFTDANSTWAPDASARSSCGAFADPDVAYVCGRLNVQTDDGRNKEGLYWRYELARAGGRVAARLRHGRQRIDLRGAPRRLRRGRPALRPRSVAAVPHGAARPSRRVRARRRTRTRRRRRRTRTSTAARCACSSTAGRSSSRGRCSAGCGRCISSRSSRTGISATRAACSISSFSPRTSRCSGRGTVYAVALGLQLGLLAAALLGVGIARYYVLVTWATVQSLVNYVRRGVPATWDVAEGTR